MVSTLFDHLVFALITYELNIQSHIFNRNKVF